MTGDAVLNLRTIERELQDMETLSATAAIAKQHGLNLVHYARTLRRAAQSFATKPAFAHGGLTDMTLRVVDIQHLRAVLAAARDA